MLPSTSTAATLPHSHHYELVKGEGTGISIGQDPFPHAVCSWGIKALSEPPQDEPSQIDQSSWISEDLLHRLYKGLSGSRPSATNTTHTGTPIWTHKSNDLYEFWQIQATTDSNHPYTQALSELKELLVRSWVPKISTDGILGHPIPLNPEKVDLSAHWYPPGGYLLCHDDAISDGSALVGQQETIRRVAFILYLNPETWDIQTDGGALALFDHAVNTAAYPTDIVKSISPSWGSFVFFEVTPSSFHQVQEVLKECGRYSISGWFHGPNPWNETDFVPPIIPVPSVISMAQDTIKEDVEVDTDLSSWMNPAYASPFALSKIQDSFLEQSSIQLRDFLLPSIWSRVLNSLDQYEDWRRCGPPNQRRYVEASFPASPTPSPSSDNLGRISPSMSLSPKPKNSCTLSALRAFFVSAAFRAWLESATGLDASTLKLMEANVRLFGPGDYTLMHDGDLQSASNAAAAANSSAVVSGYLDVYFSVSPSESDTSVADTFAGAGLLHYICGTETLLSLSSIPNALDLVYRAAASDEDGITRRFVKYVPQLAGSSGGRREFCLTFADCSEQGGDDGRSMMSEGR